MSEADIACSSTVGLFPWVWIHWPTAVWGGYIMQAGLDTRWGYVRRLSSTGLVTEQTVTSYEVRRQAETEYIREPRTEVTVELRQAAQLCRLACCEDECGTCGEAGRPLTPWWWSSNNRRPACEDRPEVVLEEGSMLPAGEGETLT